jgi:hypothetical protein
MLGGGIGYAAFDLDGTVLDERGELPARVAGGLAGLRRRGVTLIVVSGMPVRDFHPLARDPRFRRHWHRRVLLCNGDVELDLVTGAYTWRNTVPPEALSRALASGVTDIVAECGTRLVAFSRRAALAYAMAYRVPRADIPVHAGGTPAGPVVRITAFTPESQLRPVLAGLPCRLVAVPPLHATVISPTATCKAAAVADLLARQFGESGLDRVIAFGNDTNDACLLATARVGVAVAGSHPLAAARATVRLTVPLGAFLLDGLVRLPVGPAPAPPATGPCRRLCVGSTVET